ncbi:hypothetical protein B0A50_07265 [Salinomyces thailandicus]|uniref:Uncharacterized protein n=1 Tax=Salinomyces thailandicus TaxID=706561 RepID=A0A4V5N3F2_9PEZI|nr:hypothetical protein B0A50_07265 [Salinomyces thailandica]
MSQPQRSQGNYPQTDCACLHPMNNMMGNLRMYDGGQFCGSGEDLLELGDAIQQTWEATSNCADCPRDLGQTMKVLRLLDQLVAGLQASQATYSELSPGAGSMPSHCQRGNGERTVVDRSIIRLGTFLLSHPDDLKKVWAIILRDQLSRIQSMIKAARKQAHSLLDDGSFSSIQPSRLRDQVAAVDALTTGLQASIWRTIARIDMEMGE